MVYAIAGALMLMAGIFMTLLFQLGMNSANPERTARYLRISIYIIPILLVFGIVLLILGFR
jgi:hypothetical protein